MGCHLPEFLFQGYVTTLKSGGGGLGVDNMSGCGAVSPWVFIN